jgi:hypothetical protein
MTVAHCHFSERHNADASEHDHVPSGRVHKSRCATIETNHQTTKNAGRRDMINIRRDSTERSDTALSERSLDIAS